MMTFDNWLNTHPVAIRDQNTLLHMRISFNAALESAAAVADREELANSGEHVVPNSAKASASLIAMRIRSFKDKPKKGPKLPTKG